MNNSKKTLLTDYEFIFTIIASIMGVSVLSLPNVAATVAKQDGWIATILGSLYPLYVVLIASVIIRKFPNTSIMDISKKYLGNILGNILNFLFMAQFLYYAVVVVAADINLLIVYAVWFMSPLKVAIIFVFLVVYGVCKGLKVVARINVISFFLFSIMMTTTFIAVKHGSILNIQPVLGAGFSKIAEVGIDTSFAYANMELILVIHPFVKNKAKITKLALTSVLIIALLYTMTVFFALYYMGPNIVPKSLWPFYLVSESVKIPVINNFRFFIMIIWPLFLYRTVATEYLMSVSIMDNLTGIDFKKWSLYFSPLLIFIPLLLKNEVERRSFTEKVTPYVTVFNLAYITLIALLVFIKSKKAYKN